VPVVSGTLPLVSWHSIRLEMFTVSPHRSQAHLMLRSTSWTRESPQYNGHNG
jgi:hypothetical protein